MISQRRFLEMVERRIERLNLLVDMIPYEVHCAFESRPNTLPEFDYGEIWKYRAVLDTDDPDKELT